MSDERNQEMTAAQDGGRRNRVRVALAAVLVLLMLLLAVLGVFIVQVLSPVGQPDEDDVPPGLEWVRSIYGFGPAQSEQLVGPTDVAVGPDGTIWATDPTRSRVLGFNPDGSFHGVLRQGPRGRGEGLMQNPEGLAVSEDNEIYVADFGANKVLVFTPDNEFLREWEVPVPTEIAVRGDRVAVATINGIALFDSSGELFTLLGTRGSDDDQFDIPHGVAFGEDGTLFVSDTHNSRLKAYSTEGELLWTSEGGQSEDPELTRLQLPSGLTIDNAGRLVLVDPFEFSIFVADQQGQIDARYGEYGQLDGSFVYPTGIDYDPARDWFAVADTTNNRVQVVRIEGSGGTALSALARLGSSPFRICAIPLVLLLIAIVIMVVRRRRGRRNDEEDLDDLDN